MNDYVVISKSSSDPNAISPQDTIQLHQLHRTWLEEELTRPFDGRNVVITHHCPTPGALDAEHPLAPAFGSDLDKIIQASGISLWLFGHTHRQIAVRVGEVPVVNISLGYAREISDADIDWLVKRAVIDTALPALIPDR